MSAQIQIDMPSATRFIAYFDIMGFKDFVYRHDHSDVEGIFKSVATSIEKIKKIQTSDKEKVPRALSVTPVVFSDTILFISKSDTTEDFEFLSVISLIFLNDMLANRVPLKGAISHGLFTADTDRSAFFGRPLIDAYYLAEELHFYGVAFHCTAEKRYLELKSEATKIITSFLKKDRIPTKKSGDVTHLFLDLLSIKRAEIDEVARLDDLYLSVSGATRKYVDNTIKLYSRK